MRIETVILTANQTLPLDVTGEFVKVRSATGDIKVRAERRAKHDHDTGRVAPARILTDNLEMSIGDKARPGAFDLLRITDVSGAGNTVELIVGDGDHDSDSIVGSVSVTNTAATTLDSSADVTLVTATSQDIAANAARRELILEADVTNTGDLFVRDQSGTTSEGMRLKPGEKIFLSFKGALRVRNNSGANQTFGIVELTG